VIIKDEKLEPLNELAGPYEEDTDVKLICEAKGGKCRTNFMALRFIVYEQNYKL
jgi:hypothetical protein